jgi:hypothetical protein
MGFFNEHCPHCGKSVSKQAEFCRYCGCPAANAWAICTRCAASVGSEARFCWKCGAEQPDPKTRRAIFGDRWHRSPTDFAIRVELALPEKALHHGLQVDEGTLALLFQNGKFAGTLEPGYHTFDNFLQRLFAFDKGKHAYAVLVATQAADVDFFAQGIRAGHQIPIDVRLKLLFQVSDSKKFVDWVIQALPAFSAADLACTFHDSIREALQLILQKHQAEELMVEARTRQVLEGELLELLTPALEACGLKINGVRLAHFSGPAVEFLRERLGEIGRLNRESELNRALADALRQEKAGTFRDQQELDDCYEQIVQEFGFKSAERQEEKDRFVQAAKQRLQLAALRDDYELRRAEILSRLDEQKLKEQSEIAEAGHALELNRTKFEEDLRQQKLRFAAGQEQQISQATTDLEVARQGIQALNLVNEAKLENRRKHEELTNKLEAERLKLRGDASLQALLATISGEQAERVLKLAELEMRKGLSAEQALALVAEKSPEIAPAVAAALSARYSGTTKSRGPAASGEAQ